MNNLYKILNLTPEASAQQVKDQFRSLAKVYHPDSKTTSSDPRAFQMVNEAYRILSDENSRAQYDRYFSKKKRTAPKKTVNKPATKRREFSKLELIRSELNSLLWDMDDLLRENKFEMSDTIGDLYVWQIWYRTISFIEHWLLGTRDYKQKILQRRLEKYSGIINYFYDVRKHVDKLLENLDEAELYQELDLAGLNRLDLIFEVLNHTLFYLNMLSENDSLSKKEYSYINKSLILHK